MPSQCPSSLGVGRKAFSTLPCPAWCWSRGQGRSHIKHPALCCTLRCQPAWLSSPLTITHLPLLLAFHHPRHAVATKPGTSLSFTFPRVERTWLIFIEANQASSALAALRKIAEAFLSLGLFIIHQIGFQLPPSILCVVFPKIWILVYDEVSLKDLKEGHRKAKQEKGKQDDKNRHSVKRTKLSVNKIYLCRNQQRPEHEQK